MQLFVLSSMLFCELCSNYLVCCVPKSVQTILARVVSSECNSRLHWKKVVECR